MPLFDFICADCAANFEDLVPADVIPSCPQCGSANVEKKVCCCARIKSGGSESFSASSPAMPATGGCGGCSGGNCASCSR